jgi:hypothetical protein
MKELVGQGKPFYSAVDKAAGLLKRKVGTGAEFMQELKGLGGIKQSEIEDRGLGDIMGAPKMTHEQFMAALAAKPAPAIREKVLGGTRSIKNVATGVAPYHEQHTLPGGENYREMLIKSPAGVDNQEKISELDSKIRRIPMFDSTPEQQEEIIRSYEKLKALKEEEQNAPKAFGGVYHHFGGEPAILASMRLKDRVGPNGEKLLHLEELQSDWHQQGREKGYKQNLKELPKDYQVENVVSPTGKKIYYVNSSTGETLGHSANKEEAIKNAIYALNNTPNVVPDAPFKKNWEEMALKRLIHHAAEKGYHGIVVTPGAEQADRYNLANHIDSLHFSRNSDGTVDINAVKDRNTVVDKTMQTPEQIESMVGKDLAQKIFNTKTSFGSLEGLDLQVGGEGMKGFYDKKVPNILNAIGKKYGVKTELGGHTIPGDPSQRGDASERLGLAGESLADMSPEQVQAFNQKLDDSNAKQLHYFPINEQMRKDVLTNGLPLHKEGGIIHKAVGGTVQPSMNQMRAELIGKKPTSLSDLSTIGANEAPNMNVKAYIPPSGGQLPVGGVSMGNQPLPIGGIDMSQGQQGNQLMPASLIQPPQPPQGAPQGQPPQAGGMPSPLSAGASSPAQQPPSNILQMTPQGQALNAMSPPKMADGGSIPMTYKVGGSDNMPEAQPSWYQDDGEGTFNIDNIQQLAKGGDVESMKQELAAKSDAPKRIKIDAEGAGGVKGIVVPRHLLEKSSNSVGMNEINKARAKVYGSENRDPLTLGQIAKTHKTTLANHFSLPVEEQTAAEEAALNRLRQAQHIGHKANTLDKSEKLDTVNHERDPQGRAYVGFASKGVAGHSLYTSGHGKNVKRHVVNTCPGQTAGCGGGTDANGVVDTSKGTCFAPNAESQYSAAAVRRSSHEQAKHDPAMTNDWILAHTGSLRAAAETADKKNKVLLFRPNVVDETDVSSRHVIRHLNQQRKAKSKPAIIANSYGKTNELHDPENGYYVTHSNVGPKTKKGQSIAENISRDKARVRNTIMAADNKGDFVNEQGNKTPPKGSYMVTDVKRGSPMSKSMEKAITHAKYWTTGRADHELTEEEKAEGPEGHFGGNGKPTTEDKSHYGHRTLEGMRYDYQRQHVLHPRLVQVGHNDDGTPHMIPTDSRFKDEEVLNKQVKSRFKTKNGKVAGHILMTTPTESTSNLGHQTSFTHHVNEKHVEHALKNNGEYEIDRPEDQVKSANKEYVAPQPIKIVRKAHGGSIGGRHPELGEDNFHAFPELNGQAQRHLAMRDGEQEEQKANQMTYHSKHKKPVSINKKLDTMRLELTMKKAK